MADKLLLSISAAQVTAARWRGGRFATSEVFANSDEGFAQFTDYLAALAGVTAYVMVDAVEEDYRFETLPHAFGRDRAELVARKLKQLFRNTPFACATQQGRDPGKRRDDRYLFVALTNPELVQRWLAAIAGRRLPVAGVYLLPMVGEPLLARLPAKGPNVLMVSLHGPGLRLVFFRDRHLRISRLARLDTAATPGLQNLAEEVTNTRLYLHALRILTLDEHLQVVIVDRKDELGGLAETIARDNPNLECLRLTRADIIRDVGITAPALDSSSDALYLHLLGSRAPSGNLAPSSVTAGFRAHQLRRGAYAMSGVAAAVLLAWAGANALQAASLGSDAQDAERRTAQQQAAYAQVTQHFPAAPTSAENLRRAVEVYDRLAQSARTPDAAMALVSRALESHPAVVLKTLGWRYGRADIQADASRAGAAPVDAGRAGTPAPRHESALIEGEIRPFRGDYRAAIDSINAFAQSLRQSPGVAEVRVAALPLNINPATPLAGNTTVETRDRPVSAEFKLIVVMRPPA